MKRKRGFTLLELMVVILIINVLATLGLSQYGPMIEKARGAEARVILGNLRTLAAAHRMQYGALNASTGGPFFDDTMVGIDPLGTDPDMLPGACAPTHLFNYAVSVTGADTVYLIANRCEAGGKDPDAPTGRGFSIKLASGFGAAAGDTWSVVGPY